VYCLRALVPLVRVEKPRRALHAVYQRSHSIIAQGYSTGGVKTISLFGELSARWKTGFAELIDLPMIECGVEIEIAGNRKRPILPCVLAAALRAWNCGLSKSLPVHDLCWQRTPRPLLRLVGGARQRGIFSASGRKPLNPSLKICGGQLDPRPVSSRSSPFYRQLSRPEPEGEILTVSDRYVLTPAGQVGITQFCGHRAAQKGGFFGRR